MILIFLILIGGIFAGFYLITYRRLLNHLENNDPEKWKGLGRPEFSDDSDARDIKRFLQFLRSTDDIQDTELIKMKSRTKVFLFIGVILIGGPLLYWIISFFVLSLSPH